MSGVFALFLMLVWVAIALLLTYKLTRLVTNDGLRVVVGLIALGALIPLPLIDELLGRPQFERTCKARATIKMDRAVVVGKTVFYDKQPSEDLPDTWVRIVVRPQHFVDLTTNDVVISYAVVVASGGWLSRFLTEGGVPLTFQGHCAPPEDVPALLKSLAISVKDRSPTNGGPK